MSARGEINVGSLRRQRFGDSAYAEYVSGTEGAYRRQGKCLIRSPQGRRPRSTRVVDGDLVTVFVWYDNEWGYASQMVKQAIKVLATT